MPPPRHPSVDPPHLPNNQLPPLITAKYISSSTLLSLLPPPTNHPMSFTRSVLLRQSPPLPPELQCERCPPHRSSVPLRNSTPEQRLNHRRMWQRQQRITSNSNNSISSRISVSRDAPSKGATEASKSHFRRSKVEWSRS